MTGRFDPSILPSSPDLEIEKALWEAGVPYVAGIDEAGRGALAGPVTAAAIILPAEPSINRVLHGVRDSKQMSPKERDFWSFRLRDVAATWGVGFASHTEIDELGILPATLLAVQRALETLAISPAHLLLDYLFLSECEIPQTSLIKGDARSQSIAAASILAKTTRDDILREMDREYPGYGFANHKGYGTPTHLEALSFLGPCPIHRMSYSPLKRITSGSAGIWL